jgi:biopolymer transport protein ExbD
MARRKKRKKYQNRENKMELEMTPMIDVVFNLLIFFLCMPFRVPEGELDAFLPRDVGLFDDSVKLEDLEKVVVRIKDTKTRNPKVYLGNVPVRARNSAGYPDFDRLAEQLVGLKEKSGGEPPPVEIDSDPLVEYEFVIGALNACTKARIGDIRFRFPHIDPATGQIKKQANTF